MAKVEEMISMDLSTISNYIKNGEISPVEVVRNLLERIENVDPILNSFITINSEEAISEALNIEKEIKKGNYKGPLHGIPLGIKDNINTQGIKTTIGSEIYKDYVPKENSFAVNSLKKAGAIIIGKHNTHQFGYGPTGDRSYSGPVRNPYDTTKMTGGSSSGSAAAVAACLCYGAIGTDSGGSIRIPASFCGIVGMKPTYGLVSKRGVYPLSRELDHVGPMTRTILDNAILLNSITDFDSENPKAIYHQSEDYTRFIGKDIKNKTIGIPKNFFYEDLNDDIAELIQKTILIFEQLGAKVIQVELPNIEIILESQQIILRSDAYAVHERNLEDYPTYWDEEVKERLLTAFSTKGFEYSKAIQIQELAKNEFSKVLEEVDILLTPTMTIMPLDINARHLKNSKYHGQHIRQTITKLTSPTNLNGFPSLSVPAGYSAEGMPIGIQLIGNAFEEAKLYQFGHALEKTLSLKTAKLNVK